MPAPNGSHHFTKKSPSTWRLFEHKSSQLNVGLAVSHMFLRTIFSISKLDHFGNLFIKIFNRYPYSFCCDFYNVVVCTCCKLHNIIWFVSVIFYHHYVVFLTTICKVFFVIFTTFSVEKSVFFWFFGNYGILLLIVCSFSGIMV